MIASLSPFEACALDPSPYARIRPGGFMSTRPKPITEEESRRSKKESGVKAIAVEEPDDPFAEFHDGWEPVRKRKSGPPTE